MAKAQPIFHAPTGVWISPGTAGYELVGKARDKHMAELDAKSRQTAGLPSKKQEDKIAKLAIDLLAEVVLIGAHATRFVTRKQVYFDRGFTADEVKAAIQRCIVDSPAIRELVRIHEEAPQPYRLKSVSTHSEPDFLCPARTYNIMVPSVVSMYDAAITGGLRFPSVLLYVAEENSNDHVMLEESAQRAVRMFSDDADLVMDVIDPKKVVIVGFIVPKEEK